ncbi:hypothetical protein EYF80_053823 [Liparis tanakae]|uniref:Uncharacterized protein n=1 Tax=Liparis tanakae TaxID=230148 RepID=A0A4Z2F4I4_9TELE|nr:hypothetical protein EYF80_053823 [Liparis tanakae]
MKKLSNPAPLGVELREAPSDRTSDAGDSTGQLGAVAPRRARARLFLFPEHEISHGSYLAESELPTRREVRVRSFGCRQRDKTKPAKAPIKSHSERG